MTHRRRPGRPRGSRSPRVPIAVALEPHDAECVQVEADLRRKFGAEDPELGRLIQQAVACWRRALQAGDVVAALGLVLQGPQGAVRNPAVAIEAEARRAYGYFVQRLRDGVRRTKIGGPTVSERLPRTPTPSHVARTYLQAVTP
jgi:hypothetical protein